MCTARHAHITQNNKLAISLQHLKKEVNGAVYFLHADKHESLLQIDTIILMEMVKYSQVCNVIQYLKKKLEMKLTFCSTLWASKISTRWYYHYWRAWSSILKVLKVTSLKYLYNIWEKKLGIEVIFCMQKNIKISTSWYYCFWWK